MPATEDITVAEAVEAECRAAMARVPKARGWDTGRLRDDELAWVDTLLDRWLEATR
jgi:hypothetical protein